jgi:hypothetical protein
LLSSSNDVLSEIQLKCLKLQVKLDNQSQMMELMRKEIKQNRDSEARKDQQMVRDQKEFMNLMKKGYSDWKGIQEEHEEPVATPIMTN